MIKPKPTPSPLASRAMAVVMTVALMMGGYVGLKGLAVPAFASSRDVIRELDPLVFERYAAPSPPEETTAPAEEEEPEEAPEEPAEVGSFDEEVGAAMDELERMFATEEEAAPTADRPSATDEAAAPGIAADVPDDRFEALFGGGDAGVAVEGAARRRSARAGAERGGVGLGIAERTVPSEGAGGADRGAAGASEAAGPPPGLEAVTATRREAATESDVVIGEFDAESFTGSEADRLATWMREHPADLPVGVRAHVNFQPSFLTSVALVSSDGRTWDLFLMFNEALRELHIVLVEDDRSIYMIDRGFQEESRSLREGTVRRVDDRIVAVDSRTVAASGERAQDFYNVFLSWWETVRDDVGG